jgi:hypothetical protein
MSPPTTADPTPIPLLLALPDTPENTEILMGVVDAMLNGATWENWRVNNGACWLRGRRVRAGGLLLRSDGTMRGAANLPNPLRNSGDAWEMETRELSEWQTKPDGEGCDRVLHSFNYYAPNSYCRGPWHHDRKVGACLAVCTKHAEHPEVGALCKDVLRRLNLQV